MTTSYHQEWWRDQGPVKPGNRQICAVPIPPNGLQTLGRWADL